MLRRGSGTRIAVELTELLNMNMSLKELDKVVKLLNDSSLILKKFEAALKTKGLNKKIDEATGVILVDLIDKVDKTAQNMQSYSIKVSAVKESL